MFETTKRTMRVADTDRGKQIKNQKEIVEGLLDYYDEKEYR